jgi:RNA polymerase sigma-70 factor, ECF subfamily
MSHFKLVDRPAADFIPAKTNPRAGFDVAALLADARRANRQDIGELLQHYRNYLLLLANTQIEKRLQPRVSPSDIVQETMLKAHRHFGQFQGQTEKELLAWLRQILVSSLARFVEQHVLAAKRDIRREVSLERFGAAWDQSTSHFKSILRADIPSPSAAAGHREDAGALADLLAQLPPQYREVLVLRDIQGLSFEEVAARLERSPGATRMLWLRAIEKLRAIYRREKQHDP